MSDYIDPETGEVVEPTKRAEMWRPYFRLMKSFTGQGRTHQEFKEQCDVNNIIAHFMKTGEIAHINSSEPWYGDFTQASDYHDARNRLDAAERAFMDLPSGVRSVCKNNPGLFLEMAFGGPEGRAVLREAGLPIGEEAESVGDQVEAETPPEETATPPSES